MAENWECSSIFCHFLLHMQEIIVRIQFSCDTTLSTMYKRIRNVLHRTIFWHLKISKRAVQTNLKRTEARQKENFSFKFLGFILLFQELSLSLQLESNHTIVRTSIFLMVKLAFAIRSCKLERRKFQKEH